MGGKNQIFCKLPSSIDTILIWQGGGEWKVSIASKPSSGDSLFLGMKLAKWKHENAIHGASKKVSTGGGGGRGWYSNDTGTRFKASVNALVRQANSSLHTEQY